MTSLPSGHYDAINEKGLGMAGLSFVVNAKYQEVEQGRENVAQGKYEITLYTSCCNAD